LLLPTFFKILQWRAERARHCQVDSGNTSRNKVLPESKRTFIGQSCVMLLNQPYAGDRKSAILILTSGAVVARLRRATTAPEM
jgi:hypothetical protein